MFAGGDNQFSDNNSASGIQIPTASGFWLSNKTSTNITTKYKTQNAEVVDKPSEANTILATTKSISLNGIEWKAMITDPNSGEAVKGEAGTNINSNTAQVTITGTVANNGGFKYRYTGYDGQLNSNGNGNQTLPSNVTTIKIVLNKGAAGK